LERRNIEDEEFDESISNHLLQNKGEKHMKRLFKLSGIMIASMSVVVMFASGTPSTIIWIPSVDFQGYKSFHLGIDNYAFDFKKGANASGTAFPTDLGLTVGVLPDSILQAEIGFDYFEPQVSPLTLNAKIGVPEGAITDWSPAIAFGVFALGFQKNVTDADLFYGIIGKTFPLIGRLEAGYYSGNSKILVDLSGNADNSGLLLSWDRQIPEISENLWLAIDYQSGKSIFGAWSYGFSWSFSKNVSVIFARDVFNADLPSTFTTQLDINI
jgi:hypothetical protein